MTLSNQFYWSTFFLSYLFSQLAFFQDNLSNLIFIGIQLVCILALSLNNKVAFSRYRLAIFFFIITYIFWASNYLDPNYFYILLIKTILIFLFVSIPIDKDKHKSMSESYILTVVITILVLWFLTNSGIIENRVNYGTQSSIKNYMAFHNPNIGPLFVFHSAMLAFIIDNKRLFYYCLILTALLYFSDTFSRTYIIGTFILAAYYLLIKNVIPLFFFRVFAVLAFIIGCYFYTSVFHSHESILSLVGSTADQLSSLRISSYALYFSEGGIFQYVDAMYFEIIYILLPLSLIYLLKIMFSNNVKEVITLFLFAITGFGEVLFFCFTPIVFVVWKTLLSKN